MGNDGNREQPERKDWETISKRVWLHPYKNDIDVIEEDRSTKTHCDDCIEYVRVEREQVGRDRP